MSTIDYKRPLPVGCLEVWRSSRVPYCYGDGRDLLHVMGAQGQCCGYQREAGSNDPWRRWLPWHVGEWPELHQAVADVTGEPVEADGRTFVPGSGSKGSAPSQLAMPWGGGA